MKQDDFANRFMRDFAALPEREQRALTAGIYFHRRIRPLLAMAAAGLVLVGVTTPGVAGLVLLTMAALFAVLALDIPQPMKAVIWLALRLQGVDHDHQ